jgi:cell wall-associated NlpC family hydrolase
MSFINVSKAVLLCSLITLSLSSCKIARNLGISKPKKPEPVKEVVVENSKPARKADNNNISLEGFTDASLRSSIVANAFGYQGIKYRYAGRDPKGFDCSGFTCYVMSEYGIILSPASKVQATEGEQVDLGSVKPGDLVFFSRYGKGGSVTHVAMVSSNTEEGVKIIHSTSSEGVKEDNLTNSKYWMPKFLYARDVLSRKDF